jgi:uncharacterized phage protein (TIGR01671 family)
MREIKFRAWSKYKKTMLYDFILHSSSAWVDTYEECHSDCGCQEYGLIRSEAIDPVFVMQYTGLKDKNGKEIYEGDIARCRGLNTIETVVVYDIRNIPIQISAWPTIYGEGNGDSEVMGNIYENPEGE